MRQQACALLHMTTLGFFLCNCPKSTRAEGGKRLVGDAGSRQTAEAKRLHGGSGRREAQGGRVEEGRLVVI